MKSLFTFILCSSTILTHAQIDTTIFQPSAAYDDSYKFKGFVREVEWFSASFQELRVISIYEPPNFNKDSIYPVVMLTDGVAKEIAQAIEKEGFQKKIKPFIIVGIHNREPQKIDSILAGLEIDFRSREMLGDYWLTKNIEGKNNPEIVALVENRMSKYCKWIVNEVSDFMINHYNLTAKSDWTIGGFSNGGSIVLKISTVYPESFGNVISMSTAGWEEFDFSHAKSNYFLCAGTQEPSFYERTINIAENMAKKDVTFEHRSYRAGHVFNMWYSYYLDCLSRIYKD